MFLLQDKTECAAVQINNFYVMNTFLNHFVQNCNFQLANLYLLFFHIFLIIHTLYVHRMQPVTPTVPVTKFGSWNKLFHEIIKSKSKTIKGT